MILQKLRVQMELAYTPDKILTFLNNQGYGFNSERAMIEHCRDGRNLLKIIIEVISHFQPAYLRSILAMQCHRISQDIERHRQSLSFTSDFLVAKEIFKTTNFQLKLSDIIHPIHPNQPNQSYQNSREMAILGHLYNLWNWNKKVQISNEVILGKLKLLQKQEKKLRQEQAAVTAELLEVQRTKMMERSAFLQKTKLIGDIKQEVAQIRSKKNELTALKVERDKEIIDKSREYEQCLYRIQKLQIDISQAKKELSINAPQVRKQKLRQDAALQQTIAKKQHLANYVTKMRNFLQSKLTILDSNINKLKNLSPIDHLQNRSNNLKNHSKRLKQEQAYKQQGLKKLEREMENIETSVKQEQWKQEEQKNRVNELFITKSRLKESLQSRNEDMRKINEEINKLKDIYRDTKSKIQEIERQNNEQANLCDQQLKKLIKQAEEWNRNIMTAFHESHRDLNLSFYNADEITNRS